MRLLNHGYEEETISNSLYWTKGTGTVYTGRSNAATSKVSFANTGLSSDEKNMVDTATWYLGAYNGFASYVNVQYNAERQSIILGVICSPGPYCNDKVIRVSIWDGKVGLMYASDYGYATDLSLCSDELRNYHNTSSCHTNNWLRNTSRYQWTMSAKLGANQVFIVNTFGNIAVSSAFGSNLNYAVCPSVYLKSSLTISSGTGSESDPYVLIYSE